MHRRQGDSPQSVIGKVLFQSSDLRLNQGIAWAKEQALHYVFDGDPVGKWYEAALPGRESFCVRDLAHQSSGAYMLGLKDHTKNMLHKFAQHISEARDWCTYWEMNRYNQPTPVDYTDDSDFWYNLPANFDFLYCCFREYLRTGDEDYVSHPDFVHFYEKTINDYIKVWDKDGDGVPEHYAQYGRRGIASYVEDGHHPLIAGDLLAAQYAAFVAYAEMMRWSGRDGEANHWKDKADWIQREYELAWWNKEANRFYGCQLQDRSFYADFYQSANYMPLYFGMIKDSRKLKLALEDANRYERYNVEEKSHLPEICFAYGYREEGYRQLLQLTDEKLHRREYPEVSFAVIGAVFTGLLGIRLNTRENSITTLPGLPDALDYVQAGNIPLFQGEVDLKHTGNHVTELSNWSRQTIQWMATFPGEHNKLYINGKETIPSYEQDWNGNIHSFVNVWLQDGDTIQVKCFP